MKATSVFGGVALFNIVIKIIQSKVMAVLLGPAGIGIYTLLQSTSILIENVTSFGLKTSSVKNVANANSNGNSERVAIIICVLRRLVWITGLLGTLLTIALSPLLSQIAFGNSNYTFAFIWLSVTLLFNQLNAGQLVLLQGLQKMKYLANANLTGAVIGLITSLPLYYFWGIDGIVPAIIGSSLVNMLRSWYFSSKVKIVKVNVSRQMTIIEGKEMLIMGFMLSLSGLIAMGASYLLRIYISNTSGIAQVGLYGAGFMIINTYVGLVFSAMGTDYYPRLSAVATNNTQSRQLINEQAEIAILILAPILTIFLVFINEVVILLYSTKFVEVNTMIHWAALGMFFKAASWSISILFLAKGAARIFFWNEIISNFYLLILNIIGYKYGGLDGLGISFLASYFIYFFQVYFITKNKYEFSFNKRFVKIFLNQLFIGVLCFFIVMFTNKPISYYIGTFLILVSFIFSLYELNKMLNLRALINRFIKYK